MSDTPSNFCSVYSDVPYLQDAKTPFDRQQVQSYCQWANSQVMGPLPGYPKNYTVPAIKNFLPPKFSTLTTAYQFSGAGYTPNDNNYRGM